MKKVHVFTSAAFNYIPKVRLLLNSVRKYHPEFVFHLALADKLRDDIDVSHEGFDSIIPVESLDIPDVKGWAFCHAIVELATAIKPFVLKQLLERDDCEKVIYFDPDMVLFSRVDDILEGLNSANIVLTPHQLQPEENIQAVIDNEICSLKHGIYNLGFIGVSATNEGKRFANWWSERLYHFCRADISHGLFTDQRWIDLVPAFFDGVGIITSTRHNVATWNVTTRSVSGDPEQPFVDDTPLGFYHFTGFDSGAHRIMASRNAGGNKTLLAMLNWYEHENNKAEADPLARIPWAYGFFDNGQKIDSVQRLIYRERPDLQVTFKDPFMKEGYLNWWNATAKYEYPKLFNPATRDHAISEINLVLTPGFRGNLPPRVFKSLDLIKSVMTDPKVGIAIISRAIKIFRSEGARGILRRVSGH
jgi:hypothetical protein